MGEVWDIWGDDEEVIIGDLTEEEARQYLERDTTGSWYAEERSTGSWIETSDGRIYYSI